MRQLSAVIITYNEEQNIERCLKSLLGIADEIVVVDSYSTDKTKEICLNYHVNFFEHTWEGYSEQKNYGNSMAKFDWILSLDADEALSPELQQSLTAIKIEGNEFFYRICRLTNYCGTWIKHGGWYPDIKLRLFDRTQSCWEGKIHEKLNNVLERKKPLLKGDCYHYSYYTIEGHKAQALKFSQMAAIDLFEKGKNAGWIKILLSTIHKFIKGYFFKLGFLDGLAGLNIAIISANAVYLKYRKLMLLNAGK